MSKIPFSEYLDLAQNLVKAKEVLFCSRIECGQGAFDFTIKPDPEKVDPEKVEFMYEDIKSQNEKGRVLDEINRVARIMRHLDFICRRRVDQHLPVLVSEGDSWFQFPWPVSGSKNDIIDHLHDYYRVWSVGAAGDTSRNIVCDQGEYLKALHRQKKDVRGFLFSAGGNDIVGQDTYRNEPVLCRLLKKFDKDKPCDASAHIDMSVLDEKVCHLRNIYTKVIGDIRDRPEFKKLPIFIHGYDYLFPYPWDCKGKKDPRPKKWLTGPTDQYLGRPFTSKGICDLDLRRNIMEFLIDQLYRMMKELASPENGVWLVDCRGAMPDVEDWRDEIHGTSAGFEKVTVRFREVLSCVIT